MKNKISMAAIFCIVMAFAAPGLAGPLKAFDKNALPPASRNAFAETDAGLTGASSGTAVWGDYDNDDDLDVALCGGNVVDAVCEPVCEIYRNDNGVFTPVNAGLTPACNSSVAWGDYDNDGYLDLLIMGDTSYETAVTKIYHNEADSQKGRIFVENTAAVLIEIGQGKAAWGDYNNDGYLDIALTGCYGNPLNKIRISRIYRNNTDGTFKQVDPGLMNVGNGRVAWADYDNDGYLDLLLTGGDEDLNPKTEIYRNNKGNGTFTDINAGLMGSLNGAAVWGDYDNDGYLDILLTGVSTGCAVYRNNAGEGFTRIYPDLQPYFRSSAAFGDYDNDGYLDIVVAGRQDDQERHADVYRNDQNGNFEIISAGLTGVDWSSVAFGDYDNDGYLDILLMGHTGIYGRDGISVCEIYHNEGANFGLIPNTSPAPPSNGKAVIGLYKIKFSWDKSSDVQTPQDGLTYNLFVGTEQGLGDVVSPMANISSGWRKVAAIGSQNENTSWTIKKLPAGTYCWGAQAVDSGFAGSAFATGQFTVKPDISPPIPVPAPIRK